jgi:hypothetical protein
MTIVPTERRELAYKYAVNLCIRLHFSAFRVAMHHSVEVLRSPHQYYPEDKQV